MPWSRLALALLTVPLLALAAAPRAMAGGWWSSLDLEDRSLAPGDRVRVGTQFWFRSIEAAERARTGGDFRAYLVRGFDWRVLEEAMAVADPGSWWELGSARAFEVGNVRLFGFDGNLAHARASFVVPAVPPGAYALMFCDVGCTRALGDIVPSRVLVAPDRFTARLSQRVGNLALELRETRWRLRAARDRIRRVAAERATEPAAIAGRVDRLSASLRDLERRLDRAEAARDGVPWLGALGATAAALALGWAAGRRRRRPELPAVPDDLRSLVVAREEAPVGRR
ncbi:MAG TPA: hypothetical protein VNO79_04375 [Actinomycetota bacterium]|nr:hypothetical protein [Actinomycetota bacterium]